jgi:glutathione peroxidase
MATIYDFKVKTIDGQTVCLGAYRGQVLVIVNVASRCGFTPQYTELEALYQEYRGQGLAILGFPCNQFGHQEPGDEAEIKSFCSLNFGVTFPLFAKVDVNGPAADPLYQFLTRARRGLLGTRRIKWNFTKFLVDRQGTVVGRYSPLVKPARLESRIQTLLAEQPVTVG